MSLLRTKLNRSKRQPKHRRPKGLRVEGLEERRVMAAFGGLSISPVVGPSILSPPADHAGDTIAEAREVNLPAFAQRSMVDHLPSAADVDVYSFELQEGDLLVADVDRAGSNVSPQSRLSVLDGDGNVLTTYAGWSTEPESGRATPDPSLKFWAEEDGTYFLQVETTAYRYNPARAYELNLERVAVDDQDPEASRLDSGGDFHAWLNEAGDRLHVTGPSGYGFTLEADWQKTRHGGGLQRSTSRAISSRIGGQTPSTTETTTEYSAAGTILVNTSALEGSIGPIALQVPPGQTFSVTTLTPGWEELGTIQEIEGQLGFSLAPLAERIGGPIGWAISDVSVLPNWTIRLGGEVESAFPQHEIEQVLEGVPYFVYGDTGSIVAELGNAQIVAGDTDEIILVADPADPFLYVGYKDYAIAGSLNGLIPFNNEVGKRCTPFPRCGFGPEQFYGHVYVSAEHDLDLEGLPIPISLSGGVTLNLDADGDGEFLGDVLNADELLKGALDTVDGGLQAVEADAIGQSLRGIESADSSHTRNLNAVDAAFQGGGGLIVGERRDTGSALEGDLEIVDSVFGNVDSNAGGLIVVESEIAAPSAEEIAAALKSVFEDVHVGVRGEAHIAVDVGNYSLAIPIGEAEGLYSGTERAVWFRSAQGVDVDPYQGTPLDFIEGGVGVEVEGYAYADGPFSVSITGSQHLFGREAELSVAIASDGTTAGTEISANGFVELPFGRASVAGTIGLDGDFELSGTSCVDLGNDDNYIRGCAAVTLARSGSEMSIAADLDASGHFLIRVGGKEVARAKGGVGGSLDLTVDFNGEPRIESADLHYDLDVYVLGKKLGSVDGEFELEGNELSFDAFGRRFTLELPW